MKITPHDKYVSNHRERIFKLLFQLFSIYLQRTQTFKIRYIIDNKGKDLLPTMVDIIGEK